MHYLRRSKAKKTINELYQDDNAEFKMSNMWFSGFCRRYRICFCRKTHAVQKSSNELRQKIEKFPVRIILERKRGTYNSRDLVDIDRTPLSYALDDNKTYDKTASKRYGLPLVNQV